MKFEDLKAKWNGLSTTKKWLCGGVALLVLIGLAGNSDGTGQPNQDMQYTMDGQPYYQGGPYGGQDQNGNYPQGYQNGPNYAGNGQPNYGPNNNGGYNPQGNPGVPAYGGGQAYSPPDNGMAEWQANQRRQSQSVAAFNQGILDQNTIQDANTGQVYSGVDTSIATPAIESGAYTAVPTAELPVAGD
jgi:hypothetical protein